MDALRREETLLREGTESTIRNEDAYESRGTFLVDNSELKSTEVGLQYYKSKDLSDPVPNFVAMWGETVEGAFHVDDQEWVRVKSYYLPRHVFVSGCDHSREVAVLTEEVNAGRVELVLDNSILREDSAGVYWKKMKMVADDPKVMTSKLVRWGEFVAGFVEDGGNGTKWLKDGKNFLPIKIRGAKVLKRPRDVFQVTNVHLGFEFNKAGLELRRSKRWKDIKRRPNGTPVFAPWGSFISGSLVDESEGDTSAWIYVDDQTWLPVSLDAKLVVVSLAHSHAWWNEVRDRMQDRSSVTRWEGIKALKNLFPYFEQIEKSETMQMVLQMLLGYLLMPDNWVRLVCIEAMLVLTDLSLQKYAPTAAKGLDLAPWFESHLTDSFQPIRAKAIEGLSKMPNAGTDTADTLGKLAFIDDDRFLRQQAVRALGRFGAEESVELTHLLANCDVWAVRQEAALALGGMQCWKEATNPKYLNRALKALTTYLSPIHPAQELSSHKEKQAQVREACAEGLGLMGRRAIGKIAKLITALKDRSLRVRIAAASSIAKILQDESIYGNDVDNVDYHGLLNLIDKRPVTPVPSAKPEKEKSKGKHVGSSDQPENFPSLLHLAARSLVALMREGMASLVLEKMLEMEKQTEQTVLPTSTGMSSGISSKISHMTSEKERAPHSEVIASNMSVGSMAQTDLDPEFVLGLYETTTDAFRRVGVWIVPALIRSLVFKEGKWKLFFARACTMRALNATGDCDDQVLCAMLAEWVSSSLLEEVAAKCDQDVALLELTSPLAEGRLAACQLLAGETDFNEEKKDSESSSSTAEEVRRLFPKWALLFGFNGNAYLTFGVTDDHDALLREYLECETIDVETEAGVESIQVHKKVMELARTIFPHIKRDLTFFVDRMQQGGAGIAKMCFGGFGVGGSLAKAVLMLLFTDPDLRQHPRLSKTFSPKDGHGDVAFYSFGALGITRVLKNSTILNCFSKDSGAFCFEYDTLPYVSGNNAEFASAKLVVEKSNCLEEWFSIFCARRKSGEEMKDERKEIVEMLRDKERSEESTNYVKLVPKVIVEFAPTDAPLDQLWVPRSHTKYITDRYYTNAMVWRYMQAKIEHQKDRENHKQDVARLAKLLREGKMSIGHDGQSSMAAEDNIKVSSLYDHGEHQKYSQHVPAEEQIVNHEIKAFEAKLTGSSAHLKRIMSDVMDSEINTPHAQTLHKLQNEFHHRRIYIQNTMGMEQQGSTSVMRQEGTTSV
mmetsp:Transcript_150152/g.280001  ORF Transcript_150152/g.280001 Transcript_150152/m.280001 type:complete len:1235 (-) Transcript_150152:145-3849(-)